MPKHLVLRTTEYDYNDGAEVFTPDGIQIVGGFNVPYECSDASTIVEFLAGLLRHGIIESVDHDGHKRFYKQDADKLENVL